MRFSLLAAAVLLTASASAAGQDLPLVRDGLTPALPDTVSTDEIDGDNGIAVLRTTGEPFTGVVSDQWPNGVAKLRRSVVDGKPEGLWVEWHETGVVRYLATWRNGGGDGVWTYFHPNGEVRDRSTVVADVFTGPTEGWHENGRKAFEGVNQENARTGVWRFWSEDGVLDRVERYDNGEVVDERQP